jgi:DNA-binding transcriptional LysR family regulator
MTLMDAADLRIFEAVARLGGMNKAAAELNTVQSNVTQRIRLLEEALGRPLFRRHRSGVALTEAGRRLLPFAMRVRQVLDDARRAVVDDGAPQGALTIGSLESTAALRLSPLLSAYARADPDVDMVIRTGTSAELVAQVLDGRLEGAFVCGPVDHAELDEEIIFHEELVILTAPGVKNLDAVLRKPGLKIVVLRTGCSYRQRLEDVLARRGIVGMRQLEFGTLESIVSCVGAGLGITMLPKSLIGQVWREGRVALHPLPKGDAMVDTMFIRRRDAYVSSALDAFLKIARPSSKTGARAQAAE